MHSTAAAPFSSSSCASLWSLDQRAISQGVPQDMAAAATALVAKGHGWWQQTARLAAMQPIVSLCDAMYCKAVAHEAAALRAVADVLVVVGTGGASLGAQALTAFAPSPRMVRYLDNCDAHSIGQIFSSYAPDQVAWVLISKSGETVETLAASLAILAHYQAAGASLDGRVLTITSPGARPLRALAEAQGWRLMDHPPELGGRFSVFSAVGLLPAAFAGLDIHSLGQFAQQCWQQLLGSEDAAILEAAAWFAASGRARPNHVVMGYGDRLRAYTQWYKQLWAESLGKDGGGPTPVTATGSIDQHSQLQLYLDGTPDKLFTLILPAETATSLTLATVDIPGISYLGGHGMEAVMAASAEGTYETMLAKGLPLRVLRGPFSAESVCQLMVRTILETLMVAAMLGVDPYSQPAVEEGKIRARKRLGF